MTIATITNNRAVTSFARLAKPAVTALVAIGIIATLSFPTWTMHHGFGTSATPVPTADVYGFSTSLDELSNSALDTKLDAMKATGATWVRYDMSWDTVQSGGAGSYNWAAYDRIAKAISARNMHALVIIDFTPSWARESGCSSSKMCAPADPNAYAKFAGVAVARYQHYGLRDWEIWNEPNISYRYHPAADPAQYTAILKASYRTIKAADPAAVVVTGGTAPSQTDQNDYSPEDFLKAIYAAGAAGSFDAVSAHPYTYPNSPTDDLPLSAWGQLDTMHATMAANGDGGKQIWVTEFGAPTNGPDEVNDHVSEAQQATILSAAIAGWHAKSYGGPFFWYEYQDDGTSTDTSENFYGLVRADGSHKPAYATWVTATAAIH